EVGAMSRRLSQMTEEAMTTSGRAGRKAIQEAGFDAELRAKLEERIATADFRSHNASAFAEVDIPGSAGKGTRDLAGATPWTGTESAEDTALRMLTDAHKPLQGEIKAAPFRGVPIRIHVGRSASRASVGQRISEAKERSSTYGMLKDSSMSEEEKEGFRKEMCERFSPGGRTMPTTVQGLASLANERIEDAIARGQFKNLPRGKPLERDYNASSPFIDTTEYFLNKIIQRQDIVPPWIEKQQELVLAAGRFRSRLRSDWRRHAARMMASQGGTLEEQVRRAEMYAEAERRANPTVTKVMVIQEIIDKDHVSGISLTGALRGGKQGVTTSDVVQVSSPTIDTSTENPTVTVTAEVTEIPESAPQDPPPYFSRPFRDPEWEKTELSYLGLSIDNLNSITRTYNLQAPDLAKKPYYSLERELNACYADVAPLLASEIVERARAPIKKGDFRSGEGGVLAAIGGSIGAGKTKVHDEGRGKQYGLREFWRDLW
ncbi:hypothetical protein P152DRAFT_375921, partial [Eremomyces bilateralis CBS 781.70]